MRGNEESLREGVRAFIRASTADDVYQALVTYAEQNLGCDVCRIGTVTGDERSFVPRASSDSEEVDTSQTIPLSRSIAGHIYKTGTASVINDLGFTRNATANARQQSRSSPIQRSILTAPVDEYGVFQALDPEPGTFDQDDLDWMVEFISFAIDALDRVESGSNQGSATATGDTRAERERSLDLVGAIAHDLRGPLSVAEGYMNLARESVETGDVDTIDARFDRIDHAHHRIEQLVEDMQILANQARRDTSEDVVALEEVVRASWDMVPTGEAQLELEGSLDFRARRSGVQRVFENLFKNAVVHAGPRVTVRVGATDDANGFYVADDGPGIPDRVRHEIFDPGVSTGDTDIASGYGLTIIREIADAHGWRIAVMDNPEGGTRVSISGIDAV